VPAFKRDPREGYAGRFYDFLRRVRDGAQFLAEIQPTSDKSGAAMRAAPIGVYPTVDEVIKLAEHHALGPCPVRARACTNSRANAAGWVT
jgi:hypothetical protein